MPGSAGSVRQFNLEHRLGCKRRSAIEIAVQLLDGAQHLRRLPLRWRHHDDKRARSVASEYGRREVDQGRPQTQVVRTDQDGRVAHVVVPHQLPEQLGYKCQVAREGALNGHARLDVAKFERQVTVAQ